MDVLAFDRDGTLAPFGGVIEKDALLKARAKGYRLATGGGASPNEQREQWLKHFNIEPDITANKRGLVQLVHEGNRVILVDDNPPELEGVERISPQEFLNWIEGR